MNWRAWDDNFFKVMAKPFLLWQPLLSPAPVSTTKTLKSEKTLQSVWHIGLKKQIMTIVGCD